METLDHHTWLISSDYYVAASLTEGDDTEHSEELSVAPSIRLFTSPTAS